MVLREGEDALDPLLRQLPSEREGLVTESLVHGADIPRVTRSEPRVQAGHRRIK